MIEIKNDDLTKLWQYFNSLCSDLQNTTQFVNHREFKYEEMGAIKNISNKNTYSDAFQKILLSACSEFEVVSKILCNQIDSTFDIQDKSKNIFHISSIILKKYPKITESVVHTNFDIIYPLKNWTIDKQSNKVLGLMWWSDYNDLKHKRFNNIHKANLENAINALASLYIIELYLQMHVEGNLNIATNNPYFHSSYIQQYLTSSAPKSLPDFETTVS